MKSKKTLRQKKAAFNEVVAIALEMKKNLSWAKYCPDGMKHICDFFQETSTAHDKVPELVNGFNFGGKRQIFISRFTQFLEENGRNKNGWNMTDKKEIVIPEKVFIKVSSPLDQVIKIKTVREYLDGKNNPGGDFNDETLKRHHPSENETHYVERLVVNPFIKRKYGTLCEIVEKIENN